MANKRTAAPVADSQTMRPAYPELPVRRPRPWWNVAFSVALIVVLAAIGISIGRSEVIDFAAIPRYLIDPEILKGLGVTYLMMVAALTVGLSVGLVVALLRLSRSPVAKVIGGGFVWLFLGTPGIVQLIFWYNIGVVVPHLTIEIPGIGVLWEGSTNSIMTPFVAAVIGLGLHEGAYFAEIIRSGIISVDRGQRDAAQSLGIRPGKIMRSVILPQAIRVMIPPGWSRLIALLKDTSLVTVIAGGELMTSVVAIYSRNFLVLELLIVASIWYLITYTVLFALQSVVERWANRYGQQSPRKALLSTVEGMS